MREGVRMKTIASLKRGDAIASPKRVLAVVIDDVRPGLGRTLLVPLAVFPEGQKQPVFELRNYLNQGALVACRPDDAKPALTEEMREMARAAAA